MIRKRWGGVPRIFIKFNMTLLIIAATLCCCNPVFSLGGGTAALNDTFDMEGELIIPTTKSQLTMRTGPGFIYPVSRNITDCRQLEVLDKGLWYRVRYEETVGYVYSTLFQDEMGFETGMLQGVYVGIDLEGQTSYGPGRDLVPGLDSDVCRQVGQRLKQMLEDDGAVVVLSRNATEDLLEVEDRAETLNKYQCDVVYKIDSASAPASYVNGPYVEISEKPELAVYADRLSEALSRVANTAPMVVQWKENRFLNAVEKPAFVVRIGYYVTNAIDHQRLEKAEYQDQLAWAIRQFTVDNIYEFKMDGAANTGN